MESGRFLRAGVIPDQFVAFSDLGPKAKHVRPEYGAHPHLRPTGFVDLGPLAILPVIRLAPVSTRANLMGGAIAGILIG